MILKHYLFRAAKDPLNFIMLILFPLVMVAVFITTSTHGVPFDLREYNGFCLQASGMLAFNVLFFQYFCGMIVTDYLYSEFRTDMRWRIMATPKPFSHFILSAVGASIIISAINGAVVLTAARFLFNAYFNIPVTIISLIGLSIFVTLFGVLCFLLFPKKSTTTAVIMVFAFSQMVALNFSLISMAPFGELGIDSLLPIGAASNAINYASGTLFSLNTPEIYIENAIAQYGPAYADSIIARVEAIDSIWELGYNMFGSDMRLAFVNLGILAGLIATVLIAVIVVGKVRKI